jgi:hypothetical protein
MCYDLCGVLRVGYSSVQDVNREPELSPPSVDTKKVSTETVKMPPDV